MKSNIINTLTRITILSILLIMLISACGAAATPAPAETMTQPTPTETPAPVSVLVQGDAPTENIPSEDNFFLGYLLDNVTCGTHGYEITPLKGLDTQTYLFRSFNGSASIGLIDKDHNYAANDTLFISTNNQVAVYSLNQTDSCWSVANPVVPTCYGQYGDNIYMFMEPYDASSTTTREKVVKMICQPDGYIETTESVTPWVCLQDADINITQSSSGGSCEKSGQALVTWTASEPLLWPLQTPVEGATFVAEIPFHVPGTDTPGYILDETWIYNNGPSSTSSLHMTMFLNGDANVSATVSITQGQIYPTQDKAGTKWYVTNVNQRMFLWKK